MAQQPSVPLIESSFTVKNNRSETYYFGLAEGDVLNFSVDVTDAAIREVEFGAYPSTVIFSQNYVGNIEDKSISIPHTGVYYIRFYQSGFLAGRRHCKLKAGRIPLNAESAGFNSTVYWREKSDTVWYYEDEKYITHTDTIVTVAADQKVLLKRRGVSRTGLVLFSLPETYDYMALWIGTGKKANEQFKQAEEQMALNNPHVKKYGLMTDLALRGSASFVVPGGCLPVAYWLLEDKNDIEKFTTGTLPDKMGRKTTCLDFERRCEPLNGVCGIALYNGNKRKLEVNVKITTVKLVDHWGTRKIRKYRLETIQEPYLTDEER